MFDPAERLLPNPDAVLGGQAGDRGAGTSRARRSRPTGAPSRRCGRSLADSPGRGTSAPIRFDDAAAELTEGRQHFFLPRRYRDPFGHDTLVDFDDHDLLMVETRDAVDNRATVNVNDYRVLQPSLVSDPNLNQTEVAFDTLGMVVGTATAASSSPRRGGDTLDGASLPTSPRMTSISSWAPSIRMVSP